MSDKNKVLSFQRPAQHAMPPRLIEAEMQQLLMVYDRLIALLRETDNDGLDLLTDSLLALILRCRRTLEGPNDEEASRCLLREMKKELREFPKNLRSLLPGIGPRLGESMQAKLGIQFAGY
jgi:hypothetical protein